MKPDTDPKTIATLAIMVILAIVFWNSPVLYPVKAFVVLLHELSHGLAAILSGGKIDRIELSSNLGGVCWSSGGLRAVVLPAGYLGSIFFGGLILVVAARTRYDKIISLVIGCVVILITALYVRSAFGLGFGFLFGSGLIAVSFFFSEGVNDLILKFLGVTSSLYAVIDIKEDLISRTVPGSDAYAMAQEFFFPPVFWGVFWILIALVATAVFLRLAVTSRRLSENRR